MSSRTFGVYAESKAVDYLKKKQYRVIARNYRNACGEVDIIAEDKGVIVFIEVKARGSAAFGQPFEAVDYRKQQRLRRIALLYLKEIRREVPIRFDVISMSFREGDMQINHIEAAF